MQMVDYVAYYVARGVTVLNQDYLSSSGTRVNPGTRRWKLHPPEST
jgi:hypothetical protein